MSENPVRQKFSPHTYGQAQGRSGSHQGSSVNRRCQLSVVGRLWHRRSPLPQGNLLLLNVSVRYRAGYSHGCPLRKQRFQPSMSFLSQYIYARIEV